MRGLRANDVSHAVYVPDSTIAHMLGAMATAGGFEMILATREEEAVGIASGLHLGGRRAAVLMQSSGLGNSLNGLASLAIPYQIPFLLLVALRGELGEWNVVQVPLGRAIGPILDALAVPRFPLVRLDEAERTVAMAGTLAFSTRLPVAVTVSRALTGDGA